MLGNSRLSLRRHRWGKMSCFTLALVIVPLMYSSLALTAPREVRFKDYPVELSGGERLIIQGLRGNVKLIPVGSPAGQHSLIIKARKLLSGKNESAEQSLFESMSFAVKRESGLIVVELKGPTDKLAWSQWIDASAVSLSFDVEAPAMPTEIIIREGQLTTQGWKQPLTVSMVTGSVKTAGNEGALKVQIQRGDVRVDGHRGRVEIDSYSAKLGLQDVEGDLQLTNFGGESALSSIKGNIELHTQSGNSTVTKSAGAIDFLSGRGSLNIQDFEGAVHGQTNQGTVLASLLGEAEVNIESDQGTVTVKMPATSGALLRLQSEEGSVNAPDSIRSATSSTGGKIMNGRLTGTGAKGSVVVKSKSGAIRVR